MKTWRIKTKLTLLYVPPSGGKWQCMYRDIFINCNYNVASSLKIWICFYWVFFESRKTQIDKCKICVCWLCLQKSFWMTTRVHGDCGVSCVCLLQVCWPLTSWGFHWWEQISVASRRIRRRNCVSAGRSWARSILLHATTMTSEVR